MAGSGQGSGKIFHGWWIVLVAAIGLFMCFGPIVTFTFGVFLKPLSQEFGWSPVGWVMTHPTPAPVRSLRACVRWSPDMLTPRL